MTETPEAADSEQASEPPGEAAEHEQGDAPEAQPGGDPEQRAGPLARVDDLVFQIERTLVTLCALTMTVTVFLDVVYRSFATPESQFATKLKVMLGWVGVDVAYEPLRDYVTPVSLIVLAFIAGWAVFASGRRRDEREAPRGLGIAAGVAGVALSYGFVQFVVQVPSKWVCLTFMLAGCIGVGLVQLRDGDRRGLVMVVITAVFGGYGCTMLPEQFIWSRELSLILLAWLAFIGASMATRMGKHIMVDAATKVIPAPLRPWTRALGLLATTVFCIYFLVLAYNYTFGTGGAYGMGEKRPATQIPAWTITAGVVVAFALMSIRFLAQTIDAFIKPRVIEPGTGH